MPLDEVKQNIAQGLYHAVDNSSRGKSQVWNSLGIIGIGNNEHVTGFIACKTCHCVFVNDSHKTGISSL